MTLLTIVWNRNSWEILSRDQIGWECEKTARTACVPLGTYSIKPLGSAFATSSGRSLPESWVRPREPDRNLAHLNVPDVDAHHGADLFA